MLPDLPYKGAIKLRGTGRHIPNQDIHFEHTSAPMGQSYPKRGNQNTPEYARYTTSYLQDKDEDTKPDNQNMTNINDQVIAYFTTMKNCLEGMNNAEYLNIAHEQLKTNKAIEKNQDHSNLFVPKKYLINNLSFFRFFFRILLNPLKKPLFKYFLRISLKNT